ncbi:MAG: BrnA antitoxin family protein [Pseudomonadota bacterium]
MDERDRSHDAIRAAFAELVERSRRPKAAPGPLDRGGARPGIAQVAPLPASQQGRGPQKKPTKVQISIRLDQDLVEALRNGGRGWQSRANSLLRQAVGLDRAGKKSR